MHPKKPILSIITATYKMPGYLQRAVESVLAQDCQDWEMVISPDDGHDYTFWENRDVRIKVVRSAIRKSGPGSARNRALAIATGDYVSTLDDDDWLQDNFVGTVLDGLTLHDAVAVPIAYCNEDGTLIREVGTDLEYLDIRSFGRQLGSVNTISKRELFPRWSAGFAEDVVHTCQLIDQLGGRIAILPTTRYFSTVRADSICATRGDIDAEYARIVDNAGGEYFKEMSPTGISEMRDLFRFRREINNRFERRANKNVGYHEFVNGVEPGL